MRTGFSKTAAILGYIGWPLLVIICVINFIAAMITIFSPTANGNGIPLISDKIRFVAFAFLWVVASPLVYFVTSYWPLYSCLRSLTLFRFFIFFWWLWFNFNINFICYCWCF